MKTRKLFYRVLTVVVLCAVLLSPVPASAAVESASIQSEQSGGTDVLAPPGTTLSPEVAQARALEAYGQLPLSFIPNQGQVDERVSYYTQTGGQSLWFTADEVTMALPKATLRMEFLDANPLARPEGGDKLPGIANYFIGNDPARWRTNIPTYGRITYHNLWPGVDLTYEGKPGALKSTFIIAPGADPTQIRLAYHDASSLTLDERGNLVINTARGRVQESAPWAWQEIGGQRVPVAVVYQVAGQSYSFTLPEGYDSTYRLVIDPELVYSTFLGGSSEDYGDAIAVDGAGNAYVTGETHSFNFPTTPGAFDTNCGTDGICNVYYTDAFVVKLNAGGTGLVYATFLGGSSDDMGYTIAVDGAGNAYVTGRTWSDGFPTTAGAFDTSYNGDFEDVFVVKLNAAGTGLAYATFLGGSDSDRGSGIAVDGAGSAYVTGWTDSSDFPTTAGAFDTSLNGGDDAFVVKLNAGGTGLAYATFLGGSNSEDGIGIAVNGAGNAYVTGRTWSDDFPTTAGVFDTTCGDGTCQVEGGIAPDAFVVRLNAAGTGLAYATFLGGSDSDWGSGIVVDGAGSAYVTGYTYSSDFPTTAGAFDTTCGTDGACNPYMDPEWGWVPTADAFVVRLNTTGTGLVYATFLGGSSKDGGSDITADGTGNPYVTGYTYSSDFPTTTGAFDTSYNGGDGDAFVFKLNAAGTGLAYATFLGGSNKDGGSGIAVDGAGSAYVTGSTYSSEFPTTPGAFDTSLDGSTDAFVAKLALGGGGPAPFLASPCGSNCVITSYFDHCYPTYRDAPNCCSEDPLKKMCLYWAADSKHDAWYPDSGWNFRCDQSDTKKCWYYSGHNGYDYASFSIVLAAAAGRVAYVGCAVPGQAYPCPSSYGFVVDINHQNGYLTRYGHLQSASVSEGGSVSAGQPIGLVGNTGNSKGSHLHFTVYEDVNGNGRVDSGDKSVDPYGPNPPKGDLWRAYSAGASSYWLWTGSPPTSGSLLPAVGGGLMAPDGDVAVTVPAGAVTSDTTLYYTVVPEPPYTRVGAGAAAASAVRSADGTTAVSADHTFNLSAADGAGNPVTTLSASATMTVTFTDPDLTYVNSSTLGIHLWNESGNTWTLLPSTLDLASKTVSTTITTLGIYSLRGQASNPSPTVLAVDPVEGDNTIDTQITVSGTNFLDSPFVRIGEWYLPSVYFVSTSTLTGTIPAGLDPGTYDVTVENPDGQLATLSGAFTLIGNVYLPIILRNSP